MCAGIMTVFAPPSLVGLCYLVWDSGHSLAVGRRAVQQSTATCDRLPFEPGTHRSAEALG